MKKENLSRNITILLYTLVALFPVNFYLAYQLTDSVQSNTRVMQDIGRLGGALETQMHSGKLNAESMAYIEQLFQRIDKGFLQKEVSKADVGFLNPDDTFRGLYAKWKICKYGVSDAKKSFDECLKYHDRFTMSVISRTDAAQQNILYILFAALTATMLVIVFIVHLMRINIKNEHEKHSLIDSLTKLYNRAYFLDEIENASARASRTLQPLSIIFFGIDDFEHITLDKREKMIAAFGAFLVPLIRSSDVACRVGENEFSVIAPDTELKKVEILAVRLRKAVEKHRLMEGWPATISVGASQYKSGEDSQLLIQRAKQKWHEAQQFKNRVILDQ